MKYPTNINVEIHVLNRSFWLKSAQSEEHLAAKMMIES